MNLNKEAFSQKIENYKTESITQEEKIKNLEAEIIQIKSSNQKEVNDDLLSRQNALEMKENVIKEYQNEINKYKTNIENLEYQIKNQENEKEIFVEKFKLNEKKFKEDLILYRSKLDEKINDIEKLSDEKERLKFENEKLKNDLKKLESNQSMDEEFFIKITNLQNSFAEKEKKIIEDKDIEIKSSKNKGIVVEQI